MKKVEDLLSDSDPRVRREAMHYVCDVLGPKRIARLKVFLKDHDLAVRSAAVGCIAEHGDRVEQQLLTEDLIRYLIAGEQEVAEFVRVQIADQAGELNDMFMTVY